MSDKEIMDEGVPVASTSTLPTDTSSCADANSSTELLPDCEPRPIRVARPPRATIPSLTTTTTAPISPAPSSPPLPVRSPLRPPPRSISSPSSDVSPRSSIAPSIDLSATPGDTTPPDSAVSDLDLSASPQTPADATAILAMNIYDTRQRHGSLPSLSGLMDQVREEFGIIENEEDATPPLRVKPASSAPLELFKGYSTLGPIPLPLATEEAKSEKEQDEEREAEDEINRGRVSSSSTLNSVASNPSLTASSVSMMSTPASSIEFHEAGSLSPSTATTTMTMTKRHHAMHELLSSERAYASDLALIREVHIPLALGEHSFRVS
ncbi:hypothetical protein HYPSUDRAFT_621219 [Hypholoma sublateritium FD-334 SS-4]|uniref:DH domain-containing protein n=1 Tax=Hypholoma sublateritium (strain FD-334 SS-4) TaxID=945553 RepID=A0A0D2PKB0_HYPSF|nr:hypothetical protein HYPSUDRAFT_621219 [Hypholoma sublateritium FD-334 SS-4]